MGRALMFWWVPFAVALVAVLGWETNWGESLYSPPAVSPAPLSKAVVSSLLPEYKSNAEPDAYAEVIDRPLFSPSRKQAPPPAQPEPPKPQPTTGLYTLTGTMQVGSKVYAFLRETRGGKGIRAAQGDVLSGGITLSKVEPTRVVLTQYDTEEEVKLQVSKSTRTTPAAPPPPMPGHPGVPGVPTGIPGMGMPGMQPGAPTPQGGIISAQPQPQIPQHTEAPVAPAAPGLAPFVPGISSVPGAQPNPVPPRRRGAMQ